MTKGGRDKVQISVESIALSEPREGAATCSEEPDNLNQKSRGGHGPNPTKTVASEGPGREYRWNAVSVPSKFAARIVVV